jgi:hypothetical protein
VQRENYFLRRLKATTAAVALLISSKKAGAEPAFS